MSLNSRLADLATRVATEVKLAFTRMGSLSSLTTTDKTNLVAAINEVKAGSAGAPPDATTSVKGIVELSDTAQADAGSDGTTAMTPAMVKRRIDAAIAGLIDGAPGALDTLNELAAALADNADFAGTITTALAGKQPLDTDLTAIAALVSAANKMPYATGTGTWSLADLTAAGRALLDDADAASQRDTLSVYSRAQLGDPDADLVAVFEAGL